MLRVTSGDFLEMFDFSLFGFYASYISKAFFPEANDTALIERTGDKAAPAYGWPSAAAAAWSRPC